MNLFRKWIAKFPEIAQAGQDAVLFFAVWAVLSFLHV